MDDSSLPSACPPFGNMASSARFCNEAESVRCSAAPMTEGKRRKPPAERAAADDPDGIEDDPRLQILGMAQEVEKIAQRIDWTSLADEIEDEELPAQVFEDGDGDGDEGPPFNTHRCRQ